MAAPGNLRGPVLKDVVAYVEVWSANGTENYSKTFRSQLVDMGAKVSKTFNKQVTHVVFKDGYQSTWEKAQKRGVKLVSVLWVEKCRVAGAHIDESLFPAANTDQHLPSLLKKKRKCMQPKDFIPKTPENDKRLQKKFEKMAKELQQQKTTLGTNVPVLLFESNGSLVYSPTGKVYRGHHSAMKKRLQEMKEKRENLSPTSSQMIEQSDDNTVNSLHEASLNLSHDTLCSDNSSAGGLPMSADDSCGGSASGTRERKWGEFITERESDLCAALPVLQTGHGGPSAAPRPLGLWTPPRSTSSPPKAESPQQSRAAGRVVTPVSKPSRPAAQGLSDGKKRLSPVSSATKGRPEGRAQAMGSSVKRRKTPENWPASEEGRKRRRSLRQRPAACLRLWEAESGLCSVRRPAVKSLALEESSYDDYFSPDNLKERVSEGLLGEQLPSSPSPLRGQRSLSKTERTSLLDRADLSLIGRGPRPAVGTCSMAKPGPCLERLALSGADAGLGAGTSGGMPAADGTPGPCAQAEAQGGGDARPAGGDVPHTPSGLVPRMGPQGDPSPLKGSREERKECTDTQTMQKEGTPPETKESAEAHSEGELNAVGDCAEEGSTEREAPAQGSRESVKSGARHSVVAGSQKGCQDLCRPREESRKRGRGQKVTAVVMNMEQSGRRQFLGADRFAGKETPSPPARVKPPGRRLPCHDRGDRPEPGAACRPAWSGRPVPVPGVSRWPPAASRMGFRAPAFFLRATWPLSLSPLGKGRAEPGQHSCLCRLSNAHSVLPCSFPWVQSTLQGTGPCWFAGTTLLVCLTPLTLWEPCFMFISLRFVNKFICIVF
ncbi:microcephalin isoform X2 [Dama dama]|uniref:microcephalin isoform X2 n=1 Tax=Dama dama TaxID=30532 RepID=UPI002A360687|nr:microcephalin isoform X2 [Dama dama]